MKLVDLDPHWVRDDHPGRHGMGVSFDCPHCGVQRLVVWFDVPLDGGPPASSELRTHPDKLGVLRTTPLWHRAGDTFETLTLDASVDTSESGHWHGFIRNGEVT